MSPQTQTVTEPDFERLDAIGDFIEGLRNASGQWQLTPDALEAMAGDWTPIVASIPTEFFKPRDPDSLYAHAGKLGYFTAEKIADLWEAGPAAEQRLESERIKDARREKLYAAQAETIGPARKRLQDWLSRRGVTEAQICALAA